jgi:hypothetical protein
VEIFREGEGGREGCEAEVRKVKGRGTQRGEGKYKVTGTQCAALSLQVAGVDSKDSKSPRESALLSGYWWALNIKILLELQQLILSSLVSAFTLSLL